MISVRQVSALVALGIASVPKRWGTSSIIVVGAAAVVAVLLGMLTLSDSLSRTITANGRLDRALVFSQGAELEMDSVIRRPSLVSIAAAPGIRRTAQGESLASPEMGARTRLRQKASGLPGVVRVRGVSPMGLVMRSEMKLSAGRGYTPGLREVIVGRAVRDRYQGAEIGSDIPILNGTWKVVGVFEAAGSSLESELLVDAETLGRPAFTSVIVQLESPESFGRFKNALTGDPSLIVDVLREPDYAKRRADVTTRLFKLIAYFVGIVMGAAATFGAVTTLYAAVSTRTVEIATLRALGFGPGAVMISVLGEALVLSLIGAALGAALVAILLNGNAFQSGSVLTQLHVRASLVLMGIAWACGIGLLGGLVPALHAARMPVASALRAI